jgi:STAS-like domain of unknown function (DUF4325)
MSAALATRGLSMTCTLAIASATGPVDVLGTRYSAVGLRESVEHQLEGCQTLQIDFSGVFVTQSFIDELFGPLILRMGPAILGRLAFSGCNDETKAILSLVFASRLQDFASRQRAHDA